MIRKGGDVNGHCVFKVFSGTAIEVDDLSLTVKGALRFLDELVGLPPLSKVSIVHIVNNEQRVVVENPFKDGDVELAEDPRFDPSLNRKSVVVFTLGPVGGKTRPSFLTTVFDLKLERKGVDSVLVSCIPGDCGRGQKIQFVDAQIRRFSKNKVLQTIRTEVQGSEIRVGFRFGGLKSDKMYEICCCTVANNGEASRWCNMIQVRTAEQVEKAVQAPPPAPVRKARIIDLVPDVRPKKVISVHPPAAVSPSPPARFQSPAARVAEARPKKVLSVHPPAAGSPSPPARFQAAPSPAARVVVPSVSPGSRHSSGAQQESVSKKRVAVDEDDQFEHVCLICLNSESTVMALPCRHLFRCNTCSVVQEHVNALTKNCPLCRKPIGFTIQVVRNPDPLCANCNERKADVLHIKCGKVDFCSECHKRKKCIHCGVEPDEDKFCYL